MQSESKKELENENAFLKSEIQKVQKENNSLKVDLEQMKADRDWSQIPESTRFLKLWTKEIRE